MGHPHNGHHPPDPADVRPAVPKDPHPLVKLISYLLAGLILVLCGGCLVAGAVRAIDWLWPG